MLDLDECCYIYGSVPCNESNCIPEGRHLSLNFVIYNPHDIFSNLTVTWFRSTTKDISNYEVIPTISNEYQYYRVNATVPLSPTNGNCSLDLYRDTFILLIDNFTHHKNGYYWCQLSINNTYAEQSHHVWLFAGANSAVCTFSLHSLYTQMNLDVLIIIILSHFHQQLQHYHRQLYQLHYP